MGIIMATIDHNRAPYGADPAFFEPDRVQHHLLTGCRGGAGRDGNVSKSGSITTGCENSSATLFFNGGRGAGSTDTAPPYGEAGAPPVGDGVTMAAEAGGCKLLTVSGRAGLAFTGSVGAGFFTGSGFV